MKEELDAMTWLLQQHSRCSGEDSNMWINALVSMNKGTWGKAEKSILMCGSHEAWDVHMWRGTYVKEEGGTTSKFVRQFLCQNLD